MKQRYLGLLLVMGCASACAQTQRTTFTLPPDIGEGVIHACAQKENGQLRVVESQDDCRPSEIPLSWNNPEPVEIPEPKCCSKAYQLVGFSTRIFEGGDGLLQMTKACQETFTGSRICNSEEVAKTKDLPSDVGLPMTAPAPFGWVRPTAVVGRGAQIGIETIVGLQDRVEDFSCAGWSASTSGSLSSAKGLAVNRHGQFLLSACGSSLKVACCAIVEED